LKLFSISIVSVSYLAG